MAAQRNASSDDPQREPWRVFVISTALLIVLYAAVVWGCTRVTVEVQGVTHPVVAVAGWWAAFPILTLFTAVLFRLTDWGSHTWSRRIATGMVVVLAVATALASWFPLIAYADAMRYPLWPWLFPAQLHLLIATGLMLLIAPRVQSPTSEDEQSDPLMSDR